MPRKPLNEAERFWRHVESRGRKECWPWTAYRLPKSGYGQFFFRGKTTTAHRVALILCGVDVPDALNVLHSCDNPPCCNPLHLRVGTQLDNIQEMHAKGRAGDCRNFGEAHGRCVLSDAAVAEIRRLYAGGNWSQQALADHYGASQTQVSRIIRGESRA